MAKSLNALIFPSAPSTIVERRVIDVAAEVPAHKQSWWRPVVIAGDDPFNPLTHKRTGPVTTIEASQVVDTYSIVALTAQEISDRKDAAVNTINGSLYPALFKILQTIANDNRAMKRKINAIITQQGISAQVPLFPAAQTTSPANDLDAAQFKALVKSILD